MKPHNDTKEALRLFGFKSLRNEQIKPIEALRNGKSIFVNAPTSTGKSLIYQLPAVLHRNRLTIVIEPNGTFRNVPLLPVDLQLFYSALSAFCAIIK